MTPRTPSEVVEEMDNLDTTMRGLVNEFNVESVSDHEDMVETLNDLYAAMCATAEMVNNLRVAVEDALEEEEDEDDVEEDEDDSDED